jgi:hypothetical protein
MKIKTLRQFLYEKRSNEPLNPKIPAYDYIKKHVEESRVPTYVSLTSLEKLGINPWSQHEVTPLGIYVYEARYVLANVSPTTKDLSELPYVGNQPFVNVFTLKPNANVINISSTNPEFFPAKERIKPFSDADFEIYKSRLISAYKRHNRLNEDIIEDVFDDKKSKGSNAGDDFWMFVSELSEMVGGFAMVQWNKLFRDMKIDAVMDRGDGIIYASEPYQGVIFSTSVIDKVWRYENRWKPVSRYKKDDIKMTINKKKDWNDVTYDELKSMFIGFKNGDKILSEIEGMKFMPMTEEDFYNLLYVFKGPEMIGRKPDNFITNYFPISLFNAQSIDYIAKKLKSSGKIKELITFLFSIIDIIHYTKGQPWVAKNSVLLYNTDRKIINLLLNYESEIENTPLRINLLRIGPQVLDNVMGQNFSKMFIINLMKRIDHELDKHNERIDSELEETISRFIKSSPLLVRDHIVMKGFDAIKNIR